MTEHDINRIFARADNLGGSWRHMPRPTQRGYGGPIVVLFLAALAMAILMAALAYAEPDVIVHPECVTEGC